jgi:hypothetical protein
VKKEVEEAVFSIKSEAIGLDNVFLKFVKLLAPSLIPHVTIFFNFCFTHDKFPADWKVSSPSDFSDYRPIAILPCLYRRLLRCACVVRWWNT